MIQRKAPSFSPESDFAADVLDILKRRKVTFHGCPPRYLEIQRDEAGNETGDLKMWFYGYRVIDGQLRPWGGGITIQKRPETNHAFVRGNSNAFAEVIEQLIDGINARFA